MPPVFPPGGAGPSTSPRWPAGKAPPHLCDPPRCALGQRQKAPQQQSAPRPELSRQLPSLQCASPPCPRGPLLSQAPASLHLGVRRGRGRRRRRNRRPRPHCFSEGGGHSRSPVGVPFTGIKGAGDAEGAANTPWESGSGPALQGAFSRKHESASGGLRGRGLGAAAGCFCTGALGCDAQGLSSSAPASSARPATVVGSCGLGTWGGTLFSFIAL